MKKDLSRVLEAAHTVSLPKDITDQVDTFCEKIAAKYPKADIGAIQMISENTARYYHAVGEAGAGMVQDDIDLFRDISMIVTAKLFTGSVIAELASVQPLDNIYGYIYRMTFEYADNYAPDGITAGQSLGAVRSSSFASDPGEQVVARRIKAELRRELVEAKLRPLQLSQTFHSILRRASVLGRDRAQFDNTMLQTAYNKLRDELEVTALAALSAAVPAANIVGFVDPVATVDCIDRECEYGLIFDSAGEASRRVYDNIMQYPNVIITGAEGLRIMERYIKYPEQQMINPLSMMPQRGRMGVFAHRWAVYYDPSVGAQMIFGVFNPEDSMSNPVIYAPYITVAVSPEILEKDLTTTNIVFAVDRIDIADNTMLARIDIT